MFASCLLLAASVNQAKAQISLNVNIGNWTPPAEYAGTDYYYLPDVESYYYAPKRQFVYQDNGQWVFRNSLPSRYSSYRLDNGYKVAVNRPQAYRYFETDKVKYVKFKGSKGISRGNSFNAHNKIKVKGNGNGHGNGKGKGHGKH